eukprot:382007_1
MDKSAVVNQLRQFGYQSKEINQAMEFVTNKNDINEIMEKIDFMRNKRASGNINVIVNDLNDEEKSALLEGLTQLTNGRYFDKQALKIGTKTLFKINDEKKMNWNDYVKPANDHDVDVQYNYTSFQVKMRTKAFTDANITASGAYNGVQLSVSAGYSAFDEKQDISTAEQVSFTASSWIEKARIIINDENVAYSESFIKSINKLLKQESVDIGEWKDFIEKYGIFYIADCTIGGSAYATKEAKSHEYQKIEKEFKEFKSSFKIAAGDNSLAAKFGKGKENEESKKQRQEAKQMKLTCTGGKSSSCNGNNFAEWEDSVNKNANTWCIVRIDKVKPFYNLLPSDKKRKVKRIMDQIIYDMTRNSINHHGKWKPYHKGSFVTVKYHPGKFEGRGHTTGRWAAGIFTLGITQAADWDMWSCCEQVEKQSKGCKARKSYDCCNDGVSSVGCSNKWNCCDSTIKDCNHSSGKLIKKRTHPGKYEKYYYHSGEWEGRGHTAGRWAAGIFSFGIAQVGDWNWWNCCEQVEKESKGCKTIKEWDCCKKERKSVGCSNLWSCCFSTIKNCNHSSGKLIKTRTHPGDYDAYSYHPGKWEGRGHSAGRWAAGVFSFGISQVGDWSWWSCCESVDEHGTACKRSLKWNCCEKTATKNCVNNKCKEICQCNGCHSDKRWDCCESNGICKIAK